MVWGGGPKIDISKVEKRVGTNFVKKKPDLLKGTRNLLENDPSKKKKNKTKTSCFRQTVSSWMLIGIRDYLSIHLLLFNEILLKENN